MRLLPVRHDNGGRGSARQEAASDRRRDRRRDHQYLPLRHVPAGARGDPHGGETIGVTLTDAPKFSRRAFLVATAAVGGGLAIGVNPLRAVARVPRADDGSPEITAWVVIRADETVVLRIARTEMGQGSLTGLAQLVVEELECDWNKITWEFPTPGASLARNAIWGDMQTGADQGIW